MRVLVCGGRRYRDRERVWECLDKVHQKHKITVLIHGRCPTGADAFAHGWAQARGVRIEAYPALWAEHGLRAGPIRNQQMVDEGRPEAGMAFPGNVGTPDMVRRLKTAGIPVWEIK